MTTCLRLASLAGALGALALAACSGTTFSADDGGAASDAGDGGSEAAAGYTLDNVCDLTAPRICALRKPCCQSSGYGFDEAGCEAQNKSDCGKDVAEVKAGTMTFDGSHVDDCLAKVAPFYTKCTPSFDDFQKIAGVMAQCHIFTGKLGEGAACDRDSQCAPSTDAGAFTSCDSSSKTCTTTRFVGQGASCSFQQGSHVFCATGFYCDASGMPPAGTCKPATPAGQSCNTSQQPDFECGLGYYCDVPSGKCAVSKAGGSQCQGPIECASFSCSQHVCDPVDPMVKKDECVGGDGG